MTWDSSASAANGATTAPNARASACTARSSGASVKFRPSDIRYSLSSGPVGGALLDERGGAFLGVGRGADDVRDRPLPVEALRHRPVAGLHQDALGLPNRQWRVRGDDAREL